MRTRKPTFDDLNPAAWGGTADARIARLANPYAKTCIRTLRDAVLAMIEDPAITRRQLREQLQQES